MAWHILHSLLDQVRMHSTFPGKLWIVMMFIFRILVVARIGDHVYHDEQVIWLISIILMLLCLFVTIGGLRGSATSKGTRIKTKDSFFRETLII